MNHYTYLLEYVNGMLYHGVRSCNCNISEDEYYGSSKHTPNEIPKKTILTKHITRTDAVEEEARYHKKLDVKCNNLYYNKSNQKCVGFDTAGVPLTQEAKDKINSNTPRLRGQYHPMFGKVSNKKGKTLVEMYGTKKSDDIKKKMVANRTYLSGTNHVMFGKTHSQETRNKIRDSRLGQSSWNKGIPMSIITRDKLSKSRMGKHISKNDYKVITNIGDIHMVIGIGIREWFRLNLQCKYPKVCMTRSIKEDSYVMRGKWKGWKIEII